MEDDQKDLAQEEDAPETLSGDELLKEGDNLDEGKIEGDGPPPPR